jgi:hypothetical protein
MTRRGVLWVSAVLRLGLASGCGDDETQPVDAGGRDDDGSAGEVDGGGPSEADGGALIRDVPCEVATLITTHCLECHGPVGGESLSFAPLVTAADLAAESPAFPGRTRASLAVERMRSTPPFVMPPAPRATVPAAEVDAFAAWVDAGMPARSCTTRPDPS